MIENKDQSASASAATSALVETPPRGEMLGLPTLQRNALCKLFDRPEFTPQDVHALGFRRLQRADGIGHKGLQAILAWLRHYGLELLPPEPLADPPEGLPEEVRKNINGAVRLLRNHGYRVQRSRDKGIGR